MADSRKLRRNKELPKSPTGIKGLDEITFGGLPKGRPTLVCGDAGSGKSILAMEFLVRGATQYNEPGVLMTFEESAADVVQNVASLGFDLNNLTARKKLLIDHVYIERIEIEETGEYDLEGLFIRLGHAVDTIGAKRVVLDTIEAIFSGFSNTSILRAELRRLFRWLKEKKLTTVITGERGEGRLTRQGLEEYVSDCVILLDQRVNNQIATRRLHIVKYRGSRHGPDEYPFLVDERGLSVLPISSLGLDHQALSERVASGIPGLDTMLSGRGYFRGSSILVSGTAGTGKSSLAAAMVHAACWRGERCLYFAFEESPSQILRNMRSIGIDLAPFIKKNLLRFHASRATLYGLETHLVTMHKHAEEFQPHVIIIDPITNLLSVGTALEAKSMLARVIDFFKSHQITALLTSLTQGDHAEATTEAEISSLIDTWILLRFIESNGERNRGLYVLKSRGMAHSNQIREFRLTDRGIVLVEVYVGPSGVLTGTARLAQEAAEKAAALTRQQETERKQREREHKRQALEAQIAALRAKFELEAEEMDRLIVQEKQLGEVLEGDRLKMARARFAEADGKS